MCGASAFTSAPTPDFLPSMTEAASIQTAESLTHETLLSLKKVSTSFFTSAELVVVRGFQNKKKLHLSCRLSQRDKNTKLAYSILEMSNIAFNLVSSS